MANTPDNRPANQPKPPRSATKARSAKRPASRIDRSAPLHQARVFAMQALYEVDITGHGIDDIQQHLGTSRRLELELFFREALRGSRSTLATIAFLARNTDRSNPDASLIEFQSASTRAVNNWIEKPDSEDPEFADAYVTFERDRIEDLVKSHLERFRTLAEESVNVWLAMDVDDELDEETRELAATLGGFSEVAGRAEALERLDLQERNAQRQIAQLLAEREKKSLDSLLEMLRHAERLSRGVATNLGEIDPIISDAAPAFPLAQLASIDRAVLRIALQELLHETEVPFKAVINEAVDIAKQYGGPNSGRFVNGVLRTISARLQADAKAMVVPKDAAE